MSTTAAIAAVTSTLTAMIHKAVAADDVVSSGSVTARPPDRARQGAPINQINLFLYRTSIDAAWRNEDPPGSRPGETGQPPLPLVLSYLITAYGDGDDEILAHRLLGIAMGVLNDKPLLSPKLIGQSLTPGSGLESQIERVRITPDPRPQDEISRMWATFGTGYRLSVSYDAAVVLIDSTQPMRAPQPVLMRGRDDTGPAVTAFLFPEIALVIPPNRQAAAQPGDQLTLMGRNLDMISGLSLTHPLASQPVRLTTDSVSATEATVTLPNPLVLPAGLASVTGTFEALMDRPSTPGDGPQAIPSNAAPLPLAPKFVSVKPKKAKLDVNGDTTLIVSCAPAVEPTQSVALIVGTQLVTLSPALQTASTQLSFTLKNFTAGSYRLRLRVDSVDSIAVLGLHPPGSSWNPVVMQFDDSQQVVLQ